MQKKDTLLKACVLLLAISGVLTYLFINPYLSACIWLFAVISALARITFTHERIEPAGPDIWPDLLDSFLTVGTMVSTIAGVCAMLAGSPVNSIVAMAIAFTCLNLQIWFTYKPLEKWW